MGKSIAATVLAVACLTSWPAGAVLKWAANYGTNLDLSQWTRLDCGGTNGTCPCLAPNNPGPGPQFGAGRCDPLRTATSSTHATPNPIAPGASSRIQVVPNPSGVAGNVLRVQLVNGDAFADSGSITTRVELSSDTSKGDFTTYGSTDDLYFAFSVYFPSASFDHWHCSDTVPVTNPQMPHNSSYEGRCPNGVPDTANGLYGPWNVVTQWHGVSGEFGFNLSRLYESGTQQYQLNLTNYDGGIWHDSGDPSKGGAIWTDTWYHFITHIKFGTPGLIELWKAVGNGAFVKQTMNGVHNDQKGAGAAYLPPTCTSLGDGTMCTGDTLDTVNPPQPTNFKQGHYRNPTLTDSTVLYYDHTSIGDAFTDVAAQFNTGAPADFTVSASPNSVSSAPGGSVSTTVSVAAQNGFTGTVALSVSGVPAGATSSFSPASISGSSGSTLTISGGTAAAGSYPLTVTGTSGAISHTAPLTYSVSTGTAYTADAAWVKQFGSTADDYGWAAAVDPSGNLALAGYTTGNLFGGNSGGEDLAIAKLSSAGAVLWSTILGTTGNQHSFAVATDASGDVYVTGYTTAAFWTAYQGGVHDAFVAHLKGASGITAFSVVVGTAADDVGRGIAVDASGNIYVAGTTTGALVGTNAGGRDAWVAKYDASMDLLWSRQFGGAGDEDVGGVAIDGAGNVYVAGSTTAGFGGATYNGGAHDAYLVKYDTNGAAQWTKIRGTSGDDHGYAVTVAGGNPVICGSTSGSLGFTSAGGLDAWWGQYRATDAGYVNERQVGSSGDDEAFSVTADPSGNIYISGSNTAPMFVNYQGAYDLFAAKYDTTGSRVWIKNIGSSGNDVGLAVAASGSTLYVVGGTTSALGGPFQGGGFDLIVSAFVQ